MPPVDLSPLLLPEDHHLPDLTYTRAITRDQIASWRDLAVRAALWGPGERNGSTREVRNHGRVIWIGSQGQPHSPDEHTPAIIEPDVIDWLTHGFGTSGPGRPSTLEIHNARLIWRHKGNRHWAHAPAVLLADGQHQWWWHGEPAARSLPSLLDDAWTSDLTDDDVHHLLDEATAFQQEAPGPVPAAAWVTHVLSGRPDIGRWTSATRTWLALAVS